MKKRVFCLILSFVLVFSIFLRVVPTAKAGETKLSTYSFVDNYQTEEAVTGLWNYYVREVVTNTFTPLEYNGSTKRWEAPASMGVSYALIWEGKMHPSDSATATTDYQTVLQFIAPKSGTVTLSFPDGITVHNASEDGVKFSVWLNGLSDQRLNNVVYKAGTTAIDDITLEVEKGQVFNFLLHRNGTNAGDTVTVNPTVTYAAEVIEGTETIYSFVGDYQTEEAVTGLWNYYVREVVSNTFTTLKYNSSTKRWEAPTSMGTAYIWKGKMHPSETATATTDYQTVLQFVAPYSGTITVAFPNGIGVSGDSNDGVKLSFWANGTGEQKFTNVLYQAGTTEIQEYTLDVVKGQQMNFLLHRNGNTAGDTTSINPTITYTAILSDDNNNNESDNAENGEIKAIKVYDSGNGFSSNTSDIWSYYQREVYGDKYTALSYDSEKGYYADANTGAWISKNMQNTTHNANTWTVRTFTAPYSGTLAITSKDEIASTDARVEDMVFVKVWHNGKTELMSKYISADNNKLDTVRNITVEKGDKIYFMVGSASDNDKSVTWIPIVSYTTIEGYDENVVQASPKTGDNFNGSIFVFGVIASFITTLYLVYAKKQGRIKGVKYYA